MNTGNTAVNPLHGLVSGLDFILSFHFQHFKKLFFNTSDYNNNNLILLF